MNNPELPAFPIQEVSKDGEPYEPEKGFTKKELGTFLMAASIRVLSPFASSKAVAEKAALDAEAIFKVLERRPDGADHG